MIRRHVLFIGIVGLIGLMTINAAIVSSAGKPEFTFVYAGLQPPGHLEYPLTNQFIDRVKELSNGRIDFQYYDSGVLGDEAEMMELTQMGSIHMCRVATSVLGSIADPFRVFSLPFLYSSPEHILEAARSDEFQSLVGDMLEARGLYLIDFTWAGDRDLYSRVPVKKLQDAKGLRLRTWQDKYVMKAWEMVGAMPTPVSLNELYTAFQTGVVDGAEGYSGTYIAQSFHEQAPYLTKLGYLYNFHGMVINKKIWESLPEELQNVLKQAAGEISMEFHETFDVEQKGIYRDAQEKGATIFELEDKEEWRARLRSLYDKFCEDYGKEYRTFIDWVIEKES